MTAALDRLSVRVPVTKEWLTENEAKQRAYRAQRAEWRKLIGVKGAL
jgi:hypothetical protein